MGFYHEICECNVSQFRGYHARGELLDEWVYRLVITQNIIIGGNHKVYRTSTNCKQSQASESFPVE